ncbi:MAG TPA: ketopantoate reductase C-terminal domain-containing protein, partial [Anaerolineae bacterium]
PSLQLALAAGRPSEVAWLNGAVARCGAEAGIPTPVNAAYARLVTALTAGQVSRDVYRGQPARLAAEIAS